MRLASLERYLDDEDDSRISSSRRFHHRDYSPEPSPRKATSYRTRQKRYPKSHCSRCQGKCKTRAPHDRRTCPLNGGIEYYIKGSNSGKRWAHSNCTICNGEYVTKKKHNKSSCPLAEEIHKYFEDKFGSLEQCFRQARHLRFVSNIKHRIRTAKMVPESYIKSIERIAFEQRTASQNQLLDDYDNIEHLVLQLHATAELYEELTGYKTTCSTVVYKSKKAYYDDDDDDDEDDSDCGSGSGYVSGYYSDDYRAVPESSDDEDSDDEDSDDDDFRPRRFKVKASFDYDDDQYDKPSSKTKIGWGIGRLRDFCFS